MKPTVFLPEPIAECGVAILKESCDTVAPWAEGQTLMDAELKEILYGVNAVIVRLFKIEESDLDRSSVLKVIGKHGVGVDNIDCQAAAARGIPVVYTPTANANAVAEHTIGLMLALARNLVPASVALRKGRFGDRGQFTGVEVAGKTLGIVGLGRVGSRVAHAASAGLGMKVRGYDPYLNETTYQGPAELVGSIDELFRAADYLSLHVGLNPDTRHLINEERFGMLKPSCRIVNTSRGAVIDEDALIRALEGERISGAAIDVFEEEPVPMDHPLCRAPNLLMTPHISSSTAESMDRMATDSATGVVAVLQGRIPAHIVNAEALT